MGAIPDEIATDRQPPLSIPMGHFVVGVGFLLLGGLLGAASGAGAVPGQAMLAHTHLLLAGWICVTIMGAMTQFVPVWSGVELHSRRLASLQLWLVATGLVGFALVLIFGQPGWLLGPATLLVAGFWTFAYNLGRTLLAVDNWDVTEAHFALALAWFVGLTLLGVVLALSYARPGILFEYGFFRMQVRTAHATAAVFGAVGTTIVGALFQLGPMFTQAETTTVDRWLQRIEWVAYPVGVPLLVVGRLFGESTLAVAGGMLLVAGLGAVGLLLGRQLIGARTEWSPVLSRYAVVAGSLLVWATATAPVWLSDPLAYDALLGAPAARNVLVFGVLTFVVLGSLYHVVPFLVWLERYSDKIGLEPVPGVEDLYSGRLAAIDFWCVLGGAVALTVGDVIDLPTAALAIGGTLTTVGFVLFAANLVRVLTEHSPLAPAEVLTAGLARSNEPPEPN